MKKDKLMIILIISYITILVLTLPIYFDKILVPIARYSIDMGMKGTYFGDIVGALSFLFLFVFGFGLIPTIPLLLIIYIIQNPTQTDEKSVS